MKFRTKQIMTAGAGILLSMGFLIHAFLLQKPVRELSRPATGKSEVSLQVELDEKRYPVAITLYGTESAEESAEKELDRIENSLEQLVLNGNTDTDHIVSALNLPHFLSGSPVSIQWYLDSWEYINPDGTLNRLDLKEEQIVRVQAQLSCQSQKRTWERVLRLPVPEELTKQEKLDLIQSQLQQRQLENAGPTLLLPDVIEEEKISFYPIWDKRWLWILFLTAGTLALMSVGQNQDEERLLQERQRLMMMDYPDIVSRLSLYMGAGISMRNAWERIARSYEENLRCGKETREAYEAVVLALHEMESGMSENEVYERFGSRCRMPSYLKLGTLLSQNLRKGTKDLANMLAQEAGESFEERKATAKTMGEECETKLLLPMILMLMVVLIIVMYPAIISFQM